MTDTAAAHMALLYILCKKKKKKKHWCWIFTMLGNQSCSRNLALCNSFCADGLKNCLMQCSFLSRHSEYCSRPSKDSYTTFKTAQRHGQKCIALQNNFSLKGAVNHWSISDFSHMVSSRALLSDLTCSGVLFSGVFLVNLTRLSNHCEHLKTQVI